MTLFTRLIRASLLTLALSVVGPQPLLADTNPHLNDTPAETVFHYQTRVAEVIAINSLVGGLNNQMMLNAAQGAELDDMFLFMRLQSELARILAESPEAVDAELGVDPEGWISAYHTGLVGVIRVDLTSADRLLDWLSDQDLPLDREAAMPAGTGTLYAMSTDPGAPIHSHVWADDDTARFLIAPSSMNRQQLVQRLEQTPEDRSLAESNQVEDLIDQYQLTGSDLWWIDYAGLVRGLLVPDGGNLSRDLKRHVPDYRSVMSEPDTPQCRTDLIELAEITPRLHWGQTGIDIGDDELNVDAQGVLEITDTELQQELVQLEGQLPIDMGQVGNSLMRLGLTLNVDQLGDTLMAWRNRAINADWECPPLMELQAELSDVNMAAALAGAGMIQGTRGLVVELFDLDLQTDDEWKSVDALMAIQADNPQRLARTLAETMELPPGFEVPSSGKSAVLPIPDMPLRVRISGSYLVVYNGEQAAERARALGDVEHQSGLAAMAIDAPELIRHLDNLSGILGSQPAAGGMDMADNCRAMMDTQDLFSHLDVFRVGGWLGTEPSGLSVTQNLRARRSATADAPVQPGRYQLSVYEECSWVITGEDQLTADGQAEFAQADDGCSLYEERYNWESDRSALIMGSLEGRYRDSCQEDFTPWESIDDGTLRCDIVRREPDGGFQCITRDTDNTRYRYQPLN